MSQPTPDDEPDAFEVPVPLIRDYRRINREVVRALDQGHRRVRLAGVEGQRLLLAGLGGAWRATVTIVGDAGPELAAGLDAPSLTVRCLGSAADGAGRDLRDGRLVTEGTAGDALGIGMRGGLIVARARAGTRAGLRQDGGMLVLLGGAGRLWCDRRRGGLVFADLTALDLPEGRGPGGGRLVDLRPSRLDPEGDDARLLRDALEGLD